MPLAAPFLAAHARQMGRSAPKLSRGARKALQAFAWPGNVRELDILMGSAVLLAEGDIEPVLAREAGVLAVAKPTGDDYARAGDVRLQPRVEALERQLFEQASADSCDNKAKAARARELSERTLRYRLRKPALKSTPRN